MDAAKDIDKEWRRKATNRDEWRRLVRETKARNGL
jgi:hypothetical protein